MADRKPSGEASAVTAGASSDCCSAGHSLSDSAVAADVETLATLGNDTRYEALRLIAGADDGVCNQPEGLVARVIPERRERLDDGHDGRVAQRVPGRTAVARRSRRHR